MWTFFGSNWILLQFYHGGRGLERFMYILSLILHIICRGKKYITIKLRLFQRFLYPFRRNWHHIRALYWKEYVRRGQKNSLIPLQDLWEFGFETTLKSKVHSFPSRQADYHWNNFWWIEGGGGWLIIFFKKLK